MRRLRSSSRRASGRRQFPLMVYALVLPAVLYRMFWSAWPLLQTAYLSLTDTNFIYGTSSFVGVQNFKVLFADPEFWNATAITLVFSVVLVVGTVGLGLLVARMLVKRLPGQTLGRISVLMPFIIPSILAAQMWRTLAANSGSPLNTVLANVGLLDIDYAWLSEDLGARILVVAASLWRSVPFAALLFLAALSSVPNEIHEAAAMDGAGPWKRFWNIDLPMIKVIILVVTIFETIEALRTFDLVYALTQGGPGQATQLISYRAYQDMFFYGKSGYGSAQAIILLAITIVAIALLSGWLSRTQRKQA